MHERNRLTALGAALALAAAGIAGSARADINVGVTLSATGPAASLGIPEKNTFELLPTTICTRPVRSAACRFSDPVPSTRC